MEQKFIFDLGNTNIIDMKERSEAWWKMKNITMS